jgi:hypothetical protein
LRESHNIWLLDGAEADDRGGAGGMSVMPSMDAIEQFQTLASNYPPDYGISSGATFSLALKSGTQKLHGELWEFFRNDDLDANDYFNKYNTSTPTPVPELRQNIFGFNVGGPVFIPHLYKPGRRLSSSITRNGVVSSKAARRTSSPRFRMPTGPVPG